MRPIRYADGSFSREVDEDEEDWEDTGEEEMNRLHEKCKQNLSVLDVRDRLCNILELLTVCREALLESQLINIKTHVVNVLYFHVEEQIKIAEQELANL